MARGKEIVPIFNDSKILIINVSSCSIFYFDYGQLKKNLILLGATLVISLLFAEGVLHLFPTSMRHWFPENMYQNDADPKIGYRLSENINAFVRTPHFEFNVTTDDDGFRKTGEKKGKTIAVFGDSFTFGQGVGDKHTFSYLLSEKLINKHVINAGVYGYRPSQAYRTYQRVNANKEVDTVIIQLCYNDMGDQDADVVRAVYDGYLNPSPPDSLWGEFKNKLLLYSEVLARARFIYYGLQNTSLPRPDYLAPDFEIISTENLNSTKRVLANWLNEIEANNQRVILIYIPHELQVDPKVSDHVSRWKAEGKEVDLLAAQRWIPNFLKSFPKVDYVDFGPIFERHYQNSGDTLYIPYDQHNNKLGNDLIASHLSNILN